MLELCLHLQVMFKQLQHHLSHAATTPLLIPLAKLHQTLRGHKEHITVFLLQGRGVAGRTTYIHRYSELCVYYLFV